MALSNLDQSSKKVHQLGHSGATNHVGSYTDHLRCQPVKREASINFFSIIDLTPIRYIYCLYVYHDKYKHRAD